MTEVCERIMGRECGGRAWVGAEPTRGGATLGALEDSFRHRPAANFVYRIVVGVVGLAIFAVGIVAIPYPGPGWAIVFVGLGILATEFDWARRLLAFAKERYDRVMDWFRRQGRWCRPWAAPYGAVVLATLWLLGALGLVGRARRHRASVVASPIGFGDVTARTDSMVAFVNTHEKSRTRGAQETLESDR